MLVPKQSQPDVSTRVQPAVVHTLAALAGPHGRQPLVYTGDVPSSLDALRQDVVASYSALCSALNEPARTELLNGSIPAAEALGLRLPRPGNPSPIPRLPPLSTSPSPTGVLQLPWPGSPPAVPPEAGAQAGSIVAMSLGPSLGIEGVGSGVDAPARLITQGVIQYSNNNPPWRPPYTVDSGFRSSGGVFRSLSAGSGTRQTLGAPGAQVGFPMVKASGAWPLGRPSWADLPAALGGGSRGAMEGPRLGALSGVRRSQVPGSDFLGEESALVYPPAGRSYGGGPSAVARVAIAGAGGAGGGIDAMEDLRFRRASRKKIHSAEGPGDPSKALLSARRRDDQYINDFLQEYARDTQKPGKRADPRYRMPF